MYYEALAAGAGGDWWHVIILQAPLGATINVTDGDEDIDTVGTGDPMAIPVHNENSTYDITINATGFQWTDQFNTTSVSGGYEFIDVDYGTIHLSFDDDFRGQTLTITDNGSNTGTVDAPAAGNDIDLFVPALGTWFIRATIGGKTYDCHTTISDYEVAKSVRLIMVPNGQTVTPTDDIQTWLWCAEIKDKPYTTLEEVLADEYTLKRVLTNDNANDYLKRSTTWIANSGLVPILSSDTNTVSQNTQSGYYAYNAFDNDDSTFWCANNSVNPTTGYLGYNFITPKNIRKVKLKMYNSSVYNGTTLTVRYSDDGTNWTDVKSGSGSGGNDVIINLDDHGSHQYWSVYLNAATASTTTNNLAVLSLQFYEKIAALTESEVAMTAIGATDYGVETLMSDPTWKAGILASEYWEKVLPGLVPVMTSDTTPRGMAGSTVGVASDARKAYHAFSGTLDGTTWVSSGTNKTGIIYYQFENPVVVSGYMVNNDGSARTITTKLVGSNDGSTWVDVESSAHRFTDGETYFVNNATPYKYYGLYATETGTSYNNLAIALIQFYGHETGAVQSWLQAANIVKPYITIEEVLADKNTLAKLMRDHDAVDYLITAKGLIDAITNSELAMTYIGLSNYAASSLLADDEWVKGIGNSDYWEYALNNVIPIMTGPTTPSGEASSNVAALNDYYPWKAFDESESDYWGLASISANTYLMYEFDSPTKIVGHIKCKIAPTTSSSSYQTLTRTYQYYDDSTGQWVTFDGGSISGVATGGVIDHIVINGSITTSKIKLFPTATQYPTVYWYKAYGHADIDETKVKIRGAYNSSVYYKNSGVDVPLTTLVGTEGEVDVADLANIPGYPGKVRLYTTVANDPDSIGNDYWKDVIIDENTCQIDMMPDDSLYWYGEEDSELQDANTANGWTPYSSSYSLVNPTHNNDNILESSAANTQAGISSKRTKRGYVNAIVQGTTPYQSSSSYGYVADRGSKSYATMLDNYIINGSTSKNKIILRNLVGDKYPHIFANNGMGQKVYGFYLTSQNPIANFFGAANDTVYYIGAGGAHVVFAETNDLGEAVVDFSSYENETLVLYSSVAKDPNNLSDDFSKVVTIDGNDIYLMPDGEVLYWYGYVSDNLEVVNSANGWNWNNYSYAGPIFDIDHTINNKANTNVICGIGTKNKIDGVGKIKAVCDGKTANGGYYGYILGESAKIRSNADPNTEAYMYMQTAGLKTYEIPLNGNNGYIATYTWGSTNMVTHWYALYVAKHREVANFFSAANDKIYYLDSSNNPVYIAETNEYGEAYINWNYIPEGTITLYSSVAKDPDSLTDPFSKQIDNDGTLDKVYLMPDGEVLYWYGRMGDDCEELSTANGYSVNSGESFVAPTYELNDVLVTTTNGNAFSGIASKKKLSGTIHAIAHSVTSAGGAPQWCAMIAQYTTKARSSGLPDYAVISVPSGSDGKADLILPNDVYVWFYTNNTRSAKLQGFWLEP